MINWVFPETGWGVEHGLHDSGIETFKGYPLRSLTRENIQNSLDAKSKNVQGPVKVTFELVKISADDFPGKDEFKQVIGYCVANEKNNDETKKFLSKAQEVLNRQEVVFLKVSDYNTTGLTGSNQIRDTNWHHLIKSVGVSNKEAISGGSFGIGKHAAFVCSDLRTVFYVTKDEEEESAFQGAAKLITHLGAEGNPRQATGFYGEVKYNQPIKDFSLVNNVFHRSEVGTDIFVVAFNAEENWEIEIIKSVIENFFVSIHEKNLIVQVGDHIIEADNLSLLIEKYIKDDPEYDAEKYYEALTSEGHKVSIFKDFEGLGEVQLYLLNKSNFHKKVALVRNTGMKIRSRQNYQFPIRYAGVLIAKGEELNKFLRKIENPSHTDWEVKRHEDHRYANRIISRLYRWINDQIKELITQNIAESYNVEELAQYLPDDIKPDNASDQDSILEGEKAKPKEIKLEVVSRLNAINKEVLAGTVEAAVTSENEEDGEIGYSGNNNKKRKKKKKRKNKSRTDTEKGKGKGKMEQEEGDSKGHKKEPIRIVSKRIFCTDPQQGIYNILITPDADGTIFLMINVSGEEDSDPAGIDYAKDKISGENFIIKGMNSFGPVKLQKNIKTEIEVKLKNMERYALEVTFHEN